MELVPTAAHNGVFALNKAGSDTGQMVTCNVCWLWINCLMKQLKVCGDFTRKLTCNFMQNSPKTQIINSDTSIKCLDSAEHLIPSIADSSCSQGVIPSVAHHVRVERCVPTHTAKHWLPHCFFCYVTMFLYEIIGWAQVTSQILAAVTHQSPDETGLSERKCTQWIALQLRRRSMTYHKFKISAFPIHSCTTD